MGCYLKTVLGVCLCLASGLSADERLEAFLKPYGNLIYQDIVIEDQIYPIGTDVCEPRYDLIKPVLDRYERPFTVLDLGAAQGYFSFRIANDYPHGSCVMVEADDTSYYSRHGSMLYDLCLLNKRLDNIYYLQRRMDLADLRFLKRQEHFDVVLAFLVVHLMHDQLREQIKLLECLLEIGDNVILEVANDVAVLHTIYVEHLSETLDCQYLGEVKRHKDSRSTSTGQLYWFRRKATANSTDVPAVPIKKETFINLHGVYPKDVHETL